MFYGMGDYSPLGLSFYIFWRIYGLDSEFFEKVFYFGLGVAIW